MSLLLRILPLSVTLGIEFHAQREEMTSPLIPAFQKVIGLIPDGNAIRNFVDLINPRIKYLRWKAEAYLSYDLLLIFTEHYTTK
jgi:hypothetical protein